MHLTEITEYEVSQIHLAAYFNRSTSHSICPLSNIVDVVEVLEIHIESSPSWSRFIYSGSLVSGCCLAATLILYTNLRRSSWCQVGIDSLCESCCVIGRSLIIQMHTIVDLKSES